MKEFSYNVNVIQVDAQCERCGELLRPTGISLMSNPPWYVHKCKGCGSEENLRIRYPYLAYERIPDGLVAVLD